VGLTESNWIEVGLGVFGTILIPLFVYARDSRKKADQAALESAEAKGRGDVQAEQMLKTVKALHGRLDIFEDEICEIRDALLANNIIKPASVRARSRSKPPQTDD
jgi:hypothetical protein